MLYLVATPIGNLKEITFRAKEVLNSVDYIACEDTRTSSVLLNSLDIKKPLKSYHKFNENVSGNKILEDLKNGKDIALISDAGMPGISDPGNVIVKMCIENNIPYTVVSGASALINAFVLSGYETPFTFVGFLPENNADKLHLLDGLSNIKSTLIFYCSPHSILDNLKDMYSAFGNREVCVVREISKKFEEVSFTNLKDGYNGTVKGEFVVLIRVSKVENDIKDIDEKLKVLLDMGLSKTDASKVMAKITGTKKSEIYKTLNK